MKHSLRFVFLLLVLMGSFLPEQRLYSQLLKTQEEALKEVFADADTVIRRTLFLDKEQVEYVEKKSRSKVESRVVSYYVGLKDGKPFATAFFERQIVRSKPAIVMVVVNPDSSLRLMEPLAFYEPADYLLAASWFHRFQNSRLSTELWPGKKIDAVSGATLSVRAFTLMARRALAYFELIGAAQP